MLLSSVLCLWECTVCARECGKQRGNSSPENYSEQPAASESHHWNLSTSIILAPTSYGATNISMKRIITQLSHPHLWELAAYEGYFWVFNSFGWMPKWIILAYLNYQGGEVVWSVLIYGWLQYTVIQIMKRALILKNTLYSPTGSWNAPNCAAQTNTKITATVPN